MRLALVFMVIAGENDTQVFMVSVGVTSAQVFMMSFGKTNVPSYFFGKCS